MIEKKIHLSWFGMFLIIRVVFDAGDESVSPGTLKMAVAKFLRLHSSFGCGGGGGGGDWVEWRGSIKLP